MSRLAKAGAATLAACTLLVAYEAATPDTVSRPDADVTWSDPTPKPNRAAWLECVDAAWYGDDPTDATLQACDAEFGEWDYNDKDVTP